MLKRIFFDFGGCLDAPGIHTRIIFWDAFKDVGLVDDARRAEFQDAYSDADLRMMRTGEAKGLSLAEFNRHQASLISSFLKMDRLRSDNAADEITVRMRRYLSHSRRALTEFKNYRLSVISNFTGNLKLIMEESDLAAFFDSVTESFYVGASKPDPRIFQAALSLHKETPEECLYIGDNPKNDIIPSKALGMQAALIHAPGMKIDCGADYYVEDLESLLSMIQSR